MKPKTDIKEKIKLQLPDLLNQVITEIKLPFNNMVIVGFNTNTYNGSFLVEIINIAKYELYFKYENGVHFNYSSMKLDEKWTKVYQHFAKDISKVITEFLQIEDDTIDNIRPGKNQTVYLYYKNNLTPTLLYCTFVNNVWSITY